MAKTCPLFRTLGIPSENVFGFIDSKVILYMARKFTSQPTCIKQKYLSRFKKIVETGFLLSNIFWIERNQNLVADALTHLECQEKPEFFLGPFDMQAKKFTLNTEFMKGPSNLNELLELAFGGPQIEGEEETGGDLVPFLQEPECAQKSL